MSAAYTLRPAQPADLALMLEIYASTRADELALVDWSPEQKQAFVGMQFNAQAKHYSQYYPAAEYAVILQGQVAAGRLIVSREVDHILVMDIALLPAFRGAGLGTCILHDLMAEARQAGKPLRLHVETFNPALRLYQRLGFTQIDHSGVYFEMEWRPQEVATDAH